MAFSAFLFILKLKFLFICTVKFSAAFEFIIRTEPFALLIHGICAFLNSVLHFILLTVYPFTLYGHGVCASSV